MRKTLTKEERARLSRIRRRKKEMQMRIKSQRLKAEKLQEIKELEKKQMHWEVFSRFTSWVRRQYQRGHFSKRVRERAGIEVSRPMLKSMIVDIKAGRMALIPKKAFNEYEVYENPDLGGVILFDPQTGMVVTFIPYDMWEKRSA